MKDKKKFKVAVIDMNDGFPNLGMKGIIDILSAYEAAHNIELSAEIFDLRSKNEIPGINFDIYISSGGPGSPLDGAHQSWESSFSALLDTIEAYNSTHHQKKHVFLICYSFQLACRKYGVGKISRRKSGVFGILPVTLTEDGKNDIIFKGLPNPFYAVDSREWQVTDPEQQLSAIPEVQVLAIETIISIPLATNKSADDNLMTAKDQLHTHEKDRPEPCMMAVRFSKEFTGTQFHPEANPADIRIYLLEADKKEAVIADHGKEKYAGIFSQLDNPDGVILTQQHILPNFLREAIQSLNS
ncbi:type 1 glutamine amidotransferase [Pedobacter sp. L105]|uniref:type 1 glutamine amidotransferase n=1 Tax=Pedobacter sp. L105 TaxID=1641871 RepID=UPI00131D2197|nr:GMP synthase [Pedobacter sp. L105]